MTPPLITQAEYQNAYARAHLERSRVAWAMVGALRARIARWRAVRPRGGARPVPARA